MLKKAKSIAAILLTVTLLFAALVVDIAANSTDVFYVNWIEVTEEEYNILMEAVVPGI